MKKVAIFSDIHGNLEALNAILDSISKEVYDEVICLGDVISIGPDSLGCLNRILNSNVRLILGNHDLYFLNGVSNYEIESEKIEHYKYIHKNLPAELKDKLRNKDLYYKFEYKNHSFLFCHYFIKNIDDIYPFYGIGTIKRMKVKELLTIFDTEYFFYGHDHEPSHYVFNKRHLIDVGSSGCLKDNKTFYTELIIDDDVIINTKYVEYDRNLLVDKLRKSNYPMLEHYALGFFGIDDLH